MTRPRHAAGVRVVASTVLADVPGPRGSTEDLRALARDLELLVRVVRDLVALHDEVDAGLRRFATRTRAVSDAVSDPVSDAVSEGPRPAPDDPG